jgi:hypothetical protein
MVKTRDSWLTSYDEINEEAGSDIIESIIAYLGWENDIRYEEEGLLRNQGKSEKVKYNSILPVFMEWLARAGVGVDVSCRGEDKEYWGYINKLGENSLSVEHLVAIPGKDYIKYTKAIQMIKELSAFSDHGNRKDTALSRPEAEDRTMFKNKIIEDLIYLVKE